MQSNTTDHRELTVGTQTNSGTVRHIYGADKDWIVFINEDQDLKTLFTPGSDSEKLVKEKINPIAKELNLKAFQKLDKAQWSTNVDVLASCVVSALFSPNNITEMFELYRNFISDTKATKVVFGKGPNPQHIVYMDEDNRVGWEFREDRPPHMIPPLAILDDMRQVSKRVLPKLILKHASTTIGSAALAVARSGSGPVHHLEEVVSNAVGDVELLLQTYNAARYSITLFLFMSLPAAWIYNEGLSVFSAGIAGGIVGALLSSFQRSKGDLSRNSYPTLFLQALSRVLLGSVSGVIVVVLSKSGLALSMFANNMYALFIFGTVSGLAERWIPGLLLGVAKSSAESE